MLLEQIFAEVNLTTHHNV